MNKKTYRDYGLSDDDWREIVDFYYLMMIMVHDAEQRIDQRHQMVRILHGHVQKQISDRKKLLQNELRGLELLTEKF